MTGSTGPTIAVVIPTLTADRAIALAERVAGDADAVIVIDNAAETPGHRTAGAVTVVAAGINLGFGHAVMRGVSLCDQDLLLILNDDVSPGPGFVNAMARPFADPQVHAVAAHLRTRGSADTDSFGQAVDRTLRSADALAADELATVVGPSGAAAAYRRSTFVGLGGFAPELFAYWEDVDLALRMWSAGLVCRVAEDAIAEHARGSTLGHRSARQRELDAFGRGFILGRYRAWLSPADRLLVPLLDWPSLLRSSWKLRSLAVLTARSAGRHAGAEQPQAPPARPLPRRPVRATLARQLRPGTWRASGQSVSADPKRTPVS